MKDLMERFRKKGLKENARNKRVEKNKVKKRTSRRREGKRNENSITDGEEENKSERITSMIGKKKNEGFW